MLTSWVTRIATTALALASSVAGHGFLARPAARNVQHNSDWTPQGLNAGGPWTVFAKGPVPRYGVCGDPVTDPRPRKHEEGGKYATPPRIAATYRSGQVFTARVTLTANHVGRWSLRLCPTPKRLSQACFDKHVLRRADRKGMYTPVPSDRSEFSVRYRLPAGLRCKRCVMQWFYETGNSCAPRGMPRGWLETCAGEAGRVQELFWNCADVRIV